MEQDTRQAKTVMIVDDETFFRKLLRDILEQEGFTVVAEAVNGDEAVEKYLQCRPAITMMDIFMPDKYGVDATREIMAQDKDALIIMCSAIGFDDEVEAGFKAGARALVLKPFMPNEIRETIDKVLQEAA